MKNLLWLWALLLLAGCAAPGGKNTTAEAIQREMYQAARNGVQPGHLDAVNNALLPPLSAALQDVDSKPLETKFDMTVNNTPVTQVFMAIVSGTRYSMLLHPEVGGNISLNLKDVTVFEALEAVRELYGYEYKVDGTRIYIHPISLQTRLFQVNYLTGQRKGESLLRVSGGSVGEAPASTAGTTTAVQSSPTGAGRSDSSKVTMSSSADFWDELSKSLTAIVGNDKGRSVVISPMSGVIVVRAMPDELRNVAAYLKASQVSIERQVILEAKIIEVQLNDGYQSGINWGGFGYLKSSPESRGSFGQISPGASLNPNTADGAATLISNAVLSAIPGATLISSAENAGAMFGLAFQTSNFAALLNFLESQGNVHVLSSPRIATLNNQKAVLKVGTDEFFVTNVSSTTTATGGAGSVTTPSVTLQPFFSGIALDVTPRIDQNNEIILHIHPSVSQVSTVNKTVNTGTGGTLNLPLASSSVSETDSVVRVRDGQIVAIGGLMRQATFDDRSGLPGLSRTSPLFGQTSLRSEKRELVILLKPTVVDNDKDWSQDITQSRNRFSRLNGQGARP
ncbi:MAG: general secretion pathway protein GspD [Gallionellales bacterium RIFCSPLOWO2_12_FULL_59_22]|nr:MAG: general secretion pathway protein GspD [Gallionellales bacterium RIFCSPLOWO2_02_FULL_59_110]OGT13990.1 MAG: general secretion pathway protein GspD [Gallionellales bacterium RIFCSPLOWO2_12_FULL_59_22]